MKALVTGATGFVGRELLRRLPPSTAVLSRDAKRAERTLAEFDVRAFDWNATAEPPPVEAFEGVDTVFHLAGEPVAEGRWTQAKKKRMWDSRELGTRNLVAGLEQLETKPAVLVSASAVGYYGDRGDEVLDEDAAAGTGFLAELCQTWEAEARNAEQLGVRTVPVRVGIVLGEGGGALNTMLPLFRWGIAGVLGSGRQFMPWIHLADLVSMMLFAAENETVTGPLNGAAPNPVTNHEFTRTLGRVLKRPTILPAPGFGLRIVLGQFAQVLLGSQRVLPAAATSAGYKFEYAELEPAVRQILGRPSDHSHAADSVSASVA